MLIEEAANGAAVIQTLRRKVAGVVAVKPLGGKESRAAAVAPLIESGNVWLPESAVWVQDFVEECAAFPNGVHDDQVDAMSQALAKVGPRMRAVLETGLTEEQRQVRRSLVSNKAPHYDFVTKKMVYPIDVVDEREGPVKRRYTRSYRNPRLRIA
jgi:hypothetical protein